MTSEKKLLVTKWFGTFLCDSNGKTIEQKLFPREPTMIAKKLGEIADSKILEEERELASAATNLTVIEKRLTEIGEFVKKNVDIDSVQFGYTKQLLREAIFIFETAKLKALAPTLDDKALIQAVNALDEINEITNILVERTESWQKLRESYDFKTKISEKDALAALSNLSAQCNLAKTKLENFIKDSVKSLLPNVSALIGEKLAAKIVAAAGSVEKLAALPASTIQLLGAEKAFFNFLKKGTKCPKHGLLFQHPLICNTPPKLRGKIARALSGKIAIAAKADYYSGKFIGDKLLVDLEKRIEQIKSQ